MQGRGVAPVWSRPVVVGIVIVVVAMAGCGSSSTQTSSGRGTVLASAVESLPAIARVPAGAASGKVVRDYNTMRLSTPNGADRMFRDAWSSLKVAAASRRVLREMDRTYLEGDRAPHYFSYLGPQCTFSARTASGQPVTYSIGTPVEGLCVQNETQEGIDHFKSVVGRSMAELRKDGANAARLNNAAVALYLEARLDGYQHASGAEEGYFQMGSPSWLRSNMATWLFGRIESTFPPNREVMLNGALSAAWTFDDATALGHTYADGRVSPEIVDQLRAEVKAFPQDATGRIFLANLLAVQDDGGQSLSAARSTLAPLLRDVKTKALGQAAMGDADLQAAITRQERDPAAARALAERALRDYGAALKLSSDPGLHAGQAAALVFVGRMRDAVAAQRQAVNAAPSSNDFLLGLATLQEQQGDATGMWRSADRALGRTLESWNPPVSRLRFVNNPVKLPGYPPPSLQEDLGRGYLGFSFGSDRDHLSLPTAQLGGGGGPTPLPPLALPLQPIETTYPDVTVRTARASGAATLLALRAAALLQDPHKAADVVQRYKGSKWYSFQGSYEGWESDVLSGVGAARLIAGQKVKGASTANLARQTLLAAGRYGELYRLCQRLHDSECAAESLYLTALHSDHTAPARLQDLERAVSLLSAFYPKDRSETKSNGVTVDKLDASDNDLYTFKEASPYHVADSSYGDMLEYGQILAAAASTAHAVGKNPLALTYVQEGRNLLLPSAGSFDVSQDRGILASTILGDLDSIGALVTTGGQRASYTAHAAGAYDHAENQVHLLGTSPQQGLIASGANAPVPDSGAAAVALAMQQQISLHRSALLHALREP